MGGSSAKQLAAAAVTALLLFAGYMLLVEQGRVFSICRWHVFPQALGPASAVELPAGREDWGEVAQEAIRHDWPVSEEDFMRRRMRKLLAIAH